MRISRQAIRALEDLLTIFDDKEKEEKIRSFIPETKTINSDEPILALHRQFDGLSADSLKRLWEESEVSISLKEEGRLFTYTIKEKLNINKSELDKQMNSLFKNKFELYHLKNAPLMYVIREGQKTTNLTDKILTNSYRATNRAFLFPKDGIVLVMGDQSFVKKITRFGKEFLSDDFSGKTIRALDIKKYAQKLETIKTLEIACPHEISGFEGIDKMLFYGDNIVKGLYGLQKRHDVRIDFSKVGPWVGISDGNFNIKMGNKIILSHFKNLPKIRSLFDK